MAPIRAVVLVVSGGNSTYKALEQTQKETWGVLNREDIKVLWLKGDSESTSWDSASGDLFVPVRESLAGVFHKTQLGIRWVLDNWAPQFVLRTNNSSFWNFDLLAKQLEVLPTLGLYGGFAGTFEGDPHAALRRSLPYVSGAGIWMSSDVAEFFSKADVDLFSTLIDDCYMGKIAVEQNIPISSIGRADLTDYLPPIATAHTRVKHWTKPSVTQRRFYLLNNLYLARTNDERYQAARALRNLQISELAIDRRFDQPRLAAIKRLWGSLDEAVESFRTSI